MDSNITSQERKDIIAKLQEHAKEVLELKKLYRQKRPIVIEFCGSPKAGKTSCINSLEFFLKRNGFKVEIVHERASTCPVYNKKSPMFNIWTVCASIMGMLSVLEKKEAVCDVLILDRGIFDAFCWFDWLTAKKKMEDRQRKSIESFLTMDLIINRIDIVFVFTASPNISIEREYAHLLTDKPGTIMNKRSLAEYLSSIKRIYENKKYLFHKVIRINTSNKDQNDVSKEVTEKTLNELKTMLMECIGYITPSPIILDKIIKKRIFSINETLFQNYFGNISFEQRKIVENNAEWLQPIPIIVITNSEHTKVLAVKKGRKTVSPNSPERDKLLLYVGGHTRAEDSTDKNIKDLLSICRYTLRREVGEELGEAVAIDDIMPIIIYTPDTQKSKQHIGICFLYETDIDDLKLQIDKNELTLNRGTSKSGQFHDVKMLFHDNEEDFESWSIEIAKYCFGINTQRNMVNGPLFDIV
jgi:thymidylate kinase